MDALAIVRSKDPVQKTHFAIEIATTPALRWTQWPGPINGGTYGEVLAGNTYLYKSFDQTPKTQRGDSTAKVAITVTLPNADNDATFLARDLSVRKKEVTIYKVHSNEDWSIASIETYFVGRIARPQMKGHYVTLLLHAWSGRTGASPRTTMDMALAHHAAPTGEIEFTK